MRAQLEQLAEEEYRAFTAKLLPGVTDILGVRVPKLRALAKDIAKRQPAHCSVCSVYYKLVALR